MNKPDEPTNSPDEGGGGGLEQPGLAPGGV